MRKYTFVAMLLSMAVVATPVFAGTYVCQGTVTNLNVYAGTVGGTVTLSLSGGQAMSSIYLCSVTANFGNWTPSDCKAAYAILLSAKLSGQQAALEFSDSLTCTTQNTTGSPTSNYAVYIPN
jgi:hypothetical protein